MGSPDSWVALPLACAKLLAMADQNPGLMHAIRHLRKGALHRALGVPEGQKIPKAKLAAARKSEDPAIRKMANFAHTLGTFHH